MSYVIISILLFIFVCLVEKRKKNKFKNSVLLSDSIKNNFNLIKLVSSSLIFLSITMIIIINLISGGFLSYNIQEFKLSYVPYILYIVITIPFVEEYLFRFLPYSFKKYDNKLIYILIIFLSSLIFAYFHRVDLFNSVIIFIIGIVFSCMYLKTENISYSILCHILYNCLIVIRSYITFGSTSGYIILLIVSALVFVINNKRVKNV